MSMHRALTLDEIKGYLEEMIDQQNIEDDETIDIVQLPPQLDELTDCEDIDEDLLLDQELPREVPGEVELQFFSTNVLAESDNIPELFSPLQNNSQDFQIHPSRWKKMEASYSKTFSHAERCDVYKADIKKERKKRPRAKRSYRSGRKSNNNDGRFSKTS